MTSRPLLSLNNLLSRFKHIPLLSRSLWAHFYDDYAFYHYLSAKSFDDGLPSVESTSKSLPSFSSFPTCE